MLFAADTIDRVYRLFGFDATSQEVHDHLAAKLKAIETINPSLVIIIEGLFDLFDSKTTGYDPASRYLIQADVLKWLGGQGLGAEADIDDLKEIIRGLLGLKGYNGGNGGASGATFRRTDWLRHPPIWGIRGRCC